MIMAQEQLQYLRLLLEKAERGELEALAIIFSDGPALGHIAAYNKTPEAFVKMIGKIEQLKFHFMREYEASLSPIEKPGPRIVAVDPTPIS